MEGIGRSIDVLKWEMGLWRREIKSNWVEYVIGICGADYCVVYFVGRDYVG